MVICDKNYFYGNLNFPPKKYDISRMTNKQNLWKDPVFVKAFDFFIENFPCQNQFKKILPLKRWKPLRPNLAKPLLNVWSVSISTVLESTFFFNITYKGRIKPLTPPCEKHAQWSFLFLKKFVENHFRYVPNFLLVHKVIILSSLKFDSIYSFSSIIANTK